MHRGSSKGARERRVPEILPLSAPPPPPTTIPITVEFARAGRSESTVVQVVPGTEVRRVLRSTGRSAEGSAVLIDDRPVPLDTPLRAPVRLVVISTFSGG